MRWLTRTVAPETGGCNLLGILLVLGGSYAVHELTVQVTIHSSTQQRDRQWNQVVIAVVAACAATIDLVWRHSASGVVRWKRWLSPFEGGALMLCPVWILAVLVASASVAARLGVFR